MTTKVQQLLSDRPWARWTALALLAMAMFFGYIFVDILSPIETDVMTTRGWNSVAWGNYFGSETFLNVFAFFLIFAGIILDKMGVRFTAILSGAVMVGGGAINWWALTAAFQTSALAGWFDGVLNLPSAWWNITPWVEGMPASAKLSTFGFMIFGCGIEMAGITVSRGIVKWFEGKEMALAMGIEMAIARVGVAICFLCSPSLANVAGTIDVSRPVAFALFLCCVGLICFITYSFMDSKLEKQMGTNGEVADDPFKVSDLKEIFTSNVFWVVSLLCVLYYSAIFPFQNYAGAMLQNALKIDAKAAGDIFFVFPLGAAFITPFLGNYLDRKGKGASMLIAGSLLMIVCHSIFAYVLPSVPNIMLAYGAIVLLGISFALVPASLWPSVPKLIQPKLLGSAYAVIFWIQNIGLYAFRKGIGSVLATTNPGITDPLEKNYTITMSVFVGLGVLALIFGLILKAMDNKKHYGLELPNITGNKATTELTLDGESME